MANWSGVEVALEAATNSFGSAEKENAKYLDSIQGRMKAFESQMQMLSKNTIEGGFVKSVVSAGTAILTFANTDIGQLLIQITALSAIIKLAGTGIKMFQNSLLATSIQMIALDAAQKGLLATTKALWATMMASPLLPWIALGAAILAVGKALDYASKAYDRQVQKVEALFSEYENTKQEIDGLNEKLETSKLRMDELSRIKSPTYVESEELSKLKESNALLEANIEMLRLQAEAQRNQVAVETAEALGARPQAYVSREQFTENVGAYEAGGQTIVTANIISENEYIAEQIRYLEELQKTKENLIAVEDRSAEQSRTLIDTNNEIISVQGILSEKWLEQQESLSKIGDAYDVLTPTQQGYVDSVMVGSDLIANALESVREKIEAQAQEKLFNDEAIQQEVEYVKSLISNGLNFEDIASNKSFNAIEKALQGMGVSAEQVFGLIEESIVKTANTSDVFDESVESMKSKFESMEGSAQILESALQEIDETGGLTAKTLFSLVDNDLLQYLDLSSGKLTDNADAMFDTSEAAKILAIEQLRAAATADLLSLAEGDVESLSNSAKIAIANVGDNAEISGEQMLTATQRASGFAASLQMVVDGANGKLGAGVDVEQFQAESQAIIDMYTNATKQISNMVITAPSGGGRSSSKSKSGKSSGSGSKKETDLIKEQFEEQYKALKYKHEMGLKTDEEYYTELDAINQQFYKNSKEHLDEYQKYEVEVYKGMQKVHEDKLKKQAEAFKASIQDLEHELFGAEDTKNYDKQIEIYKQMQADTHAEANRYRELGKKETDDEIQELQVKWIGYKNKIKGVYEDITNNLKDNFTKSTEAIVDKLTDLDRKMSRLGDTDYQSKKSILNEQMSERIKLANELTMQMSYLKNSTDENIQGTDAYKSLLADLKDQFESNIDSIQSLVDAQKSLAEAQIAEIESTQETIVNMLKQRYQVEADLQDESHKARIKALNEEKKSLQDQKKNYADYADSRLKVLKDMWAEEDKRKAQQESESEIEDLQSEIAKLQTAAVTGDAEAYIYRSSNMNPIAQGCVA